MDVELQFNASSENAILYSNHNRLEEWIHLFLLGEGNNEAFSLGLQKEVRCYEEPKLMDLNLFVRCCGPEPNMKYHNPKAAFDDRVERIMKRFQTGNWDMPPLIINQDQEVYELNDGNHRYEALMRMGIDRYFVIIWRTNRQNAD